MSKPHRHKRKKLFVNSRIQGRALLRIGLYWGLYHFVLWQAMFVYHYMEHRLQLMTTPGTVPMTFLELYSDFFARYRALVVCAIAVFPWILWDVLKTTHRVAGPLVRFQNTLNQLARGEKVPEMRLRKGDLLVELQDAFNRYLRSADLIAEQKDQTPNQANTAPEEAESSRQPVLAGS